MFQGVTYSFQWAKLEFGSTNPIPGLTNQSIAMTNVSFSDSGIYSSVLIASVGGETMVTNVSLLRLIVTPRVQNPRILPNRTFEFTYEYPGPNAPFFSVRASSDPTRPPYLLEYAGTTTAVGGGLYRFTDPLATNHARRFYRLE